MRKPASISIFVLAALLAASQTLFAGHLTTHVNTSVSNCEWCVCQGQTFVAPVPGLEPVIVVRQLGCSLQPVRITLHSETLPRRYQSRAPPAVL